MVVAIGAVSLPPSNFLLLCLRMRRHRHHKMTYRLHWKRRDSGRRYDWECAPWRVVCSGETRNVTGRVETASPAWINKRNYTIVSLRPSRPPPWANGVRTHVAVYFAIVESSAITFPSSTQIGELVTQFLSSRLVFNYSHR